MVATCTRALSICLYGVTEKGHHVLPGFSRARVQLPVVLFTLKSCDYDIIGMRYCCHGFFMHSLSILYRTPVLMVIVKNVMKSVMVAVVTTCKALSFTCSTSVLMALLCCSRDVILLLWLPRACSRLPVLGQRLVFRRRQGAVYVSTDVTVAMEKDAHRHLVPATRGGGPAVKGIAKFKVTV